MAWFGFGKKQKEAGNFSFRVDDIFSIKGHGVVVTGQVEEGAVRKGDKVRLLRNGAVLFTCSIGGIEQPDPAQMGERPMRMLHPDEARADGPFHGSYGFLIPNHGPEDFRPGDRLLIGNE